MSSISIRPLLLSSPLGGPVWYETLNCLATGIDSWISLGRISGAGGIGAGGVIAPPGTTTAFVSPSGVRFLGGAGGWSLTGPVGLELFELLTVCLSSLTFPGLTGFVSTPGPGLGYTGASLTWIAPPAISVLAPVWSLTGPTGLELLSAVSLILDALRISPEVILTSLGVGSSSFVGGVLL